jgi:shikimate dehydrogenase
MNGRFLVVGDPIAHSLSPRIHRAFGEQHGIDINYSAQRVPAGELADFLAQQSSELLGLNVTSPLKHEAFGTATHHSEAAMACGSVNTLQRTENGWYGETTDGIGLVRDLENNLDIALRGRRILLLGAGGAAAAVAPALAGQQVAQLLIANRTHDKACALADRCGANSLAIHWDELPNIDSPDVLIHALSSGLHGETVKLPPGFLRNTALAYDLSYGKGAQAFLDQAIQLGAQRCSDGLGMLVEQAAASFALWHGKTVQTDAVLQALRGDCVG